MQSKSKAKAGKQASGLTSKEITTISRRERRRWFEHYNILKENHLVNLLFLANYKSYAKGNNLNLREMFVLVIAFLNKSKNMRLADIYTIVKEMEGGDDGRWNLYRDATYKLAKDGYLNRIRTKVDKNGRNSIYSLSGLGYTTVVSFKAQFNQHTERIKNNIGGTN